MIFILEVFTIQSLRLREGTGSGADPPPARQLLWFEKSMLASVQNLPE
jgi:hypothetical protein